MKTIRSGACGLVIAAILVVAGCDSFLEPEVHSQLGPDIVTTGAGLEAAMASAYANLALNNGAGNNILHVEENTTDIEWETGGGANRRAVLFIHFNWDASTSIFTNMWHPRYRAVRDANTIIENVDKADVPESRKEALRAEARYIRAVSYLYLYNWFGPVPLRKSTEDPLELPRATQEEMLTFIETELSEIIPALPAPGTGPVYGRAHSGAARAQLVKFYLNTKQWQKAADMAQEVIGMGAFELEPDYVEMFRVENEQNREFIWAHPALSEGPYNYHMNGAFPPAFKEQPRLGVTFTSGMRNWARQDRIWDDFYNSFEPGDKRQDLLIADYINQQGELVSLLDNDNTRSFKYLPDPNAQVGHGNDVPDIRYADILLSRAEALNELRGPNQESIDLINEVRGRAGLDELSLGDFGSKEALRMHILAERGWEFYSERKRREDLIRMDKLVEFAQARGENAQPRHRLFPIPQEAIDANPKLKGAQNDGY